MISKNIVKILKQSLANEGHASLLVCGCSSPLKIFHELNQAKLDWKNITISLIDDRIVNNDHPDSNEFLVKNHLLKNSFNILAAEPFLSLLSTSTVICLVNNSNKIPVLRIFECFVFKLILNSNHLYNTSYINI